MTDPDNPEDDRAVAAEYALGLLDGAEVRAFEARIARMPALRADYAFWTESLAAMALELPEEAPPPTTFEDIEDRLFPLQKRRALGLFGSVRSALITIGAAVAMAVAVAYWPQTTAGPETGFELTDADSFQRIGLDATQGSIDLILGADFVPAPEGQDYEMWLIVGDAPPVSLGLVPRDLRGTVAIDLPAGAAAGGIFAISLEPQGGAPDAVPTEVLATAEIAAAL